MWDVILDALLDSVKILPFLLAIYLVIELLEANSRLKEKTVRLLNGKLAPLVAGGVGLVPQCGFSVMATDLYCQGFLKTGTLIAFFVATSDEALPLLLSSPKTVDVVWIVALVKLVYAVALGYAINALDRRKLATEYQTHDDEGCCHHDIHGEHKGFWSFVKHPLLHTLKIFVYIFVVTAIFGLLLYYFEQPIMQFTAGLGAFQSFFTAAIGLVPNCASSVIITGMYMSGDASGSLISFSAMLAGLVSNSGIALTVLFKDKSTKRNLLIVAILYLAGVLCGIVTEIICALI